MALSPVRLIRTAITRDVKRRLEPRFAGARAALYYFGGSMRPGQNKRMRGRSSGRKGPNPLTRSYESNGPDVKIRGTAQHIAEKYLQLARDAQSSGDLVMAESLLQHAEHYFRLISAAQAAQGMPGYPRTPADSEVDLDEDDDFAALPDRFAPLSERLPSAAYQQGQQPQPYAAQPQPPIQYPPPPPIPQMMQPQPFEDRPMPDMRVDSRPDREPRQPRQDRQPYGEPRGRSRHGEGQERPRYGEQQQGGFDRNGGGRGERRFPRPEASGDAAAALPSFITAPVARPAPNEAPAPEAFDAGERVEAQETDGVNFHLSARRRRRPRMAQEDGAEAPVETVSELPLES